MDSFRSHLVARAFGDGTSSSTMDAVIVLLSLVFFGLIIVAVLITLRRMRAQRMDANVLPQYEVEVKRTGNHRRLTIETRNAHHSVVVINKDGQPMLSNPHSPPHSPDNVPEIHITFPDEHDELGRAKSGRVVVVRLGETGTVGMEPYQQEQLPAYEEESKTEFYSVDIDKIGGLREKERQ